MPEVFHGASGFYYKVGYRKLNTTVFTIYEVTDLSMTRFEIPSPGVYEKYQFYVRSVNELGDGPTARIFTNYSGRPSMG